MTEQELKELLEKAGNDTITTDEEISLLQALNKGADALEDIINSIEKDNVSE